MCGILGFYNVTNLKSRLADGLATIQHRGVEGAGVCASHSDGSGIFYFRQSGLVKDFCETADFVRWDDAEARLAVAHVRFGTSGTAAHICNVQPFVRYTRFGRIAIAHNGDTPSAHAQRMAHLEAGDVFEGDSDSELFLVGIQKSRASNVFDAIAETLAASHGTFSIILMGEDWVVAARDPWGNRPLSVGRLGDGWVFASETVTHDVLRAHYMRDVMPGEMLICHNHGLWQKQFAHSRRLHQCVFEQTYLSRPDSVIFGETVAEFRRRVGHFMAGIVPAYAGEIIVPVPDSGASYAHGFAQARGTSCTPALVRSHYGGRSYIEPQQSRREISIRRKLNPVRVWVEGKTVILIDDSVVRGTTSRKIVRMLKAAGASRIVLVVCFPPVVGPCYYGTLIEDTVVAACRTIEQVRQEIEPEHLDALYYPPPDAYKALTNNPGHFCFACTDGIYPSLVHIQNTTPP